MTQHTAQRTGTQNPNPFLGAFQEVVKTEQRFLEYYLAERVVTTLGLNWEDDYSHIVGLRNSVGSGGSFTAAIRALEKADPAKFQTNLQQVTDNPDQIAALYHLADTFNDLTKVQIPACELYGVLHAMGIKIDAPQSDNKILESNAYNAWGRRHAEDTAPDSLVERLRNLQASLNTLSDLFQRAGITPKDTDKSVTVTPTFLLQNLFGIKVPVDFDALIQAAAARASTDRQQARVSKAMKFPANANMFVQTNGLTPQF